MERKDTETHCHCGADKRGSDHCHCCGCEEFEATCDHVTCGDGFDRAQLDNVDVIDDATPEHPNGSCERVVRRDPRPNEAVEPDAAPAPKEPKDS